jgi:hypothetical protein
VNIHKLRGEADITSHPSWVLRPALVPQTDARITGSDWGYLDELTFGSARR